MIYRSEIDGLRAISVIAVVLFHLKLDFFSGGFLGVDVFFVISGYLITNIIYQDLTTNQFSFINFYERRIRRLLPMILITMIITLPFAYILMIPSELIDYSHSFITSSFFTSNFYFWREDGYFRGIDGLKPLLHMWSLSVEEQFYILFPIFLFFLFKLKQKIIYFIIIFALISFFINLLFFYKSEISREAVFYLLPTRGWEILLGSLCIFKKNIKFNVSSNLISGFGLIIILISFIILDSSYPFPSQYSLLAVIGTVLIILFGSNETIVGKILSYNPLVKVGLISFSIYILHQPLFAFIRLSNLEGNYNYFIYIISLLLLPTSYLSWKYIEKPFRKRGKNEIISTKNTFIVFFIFLLFSVFIWLTINKTDGFLNRYDDKDKYLANFDLKEAEVFVEKKFNSLILNQFENNKLSNVLIIGDSIAMDFVNIINENNLSGNINLSTYYISRSCGNLFLKNDYLVPKMSKADINRCLNTDRYHNEVLRKLIIKSDYIILVSAWRKWTIPLLQESINNINKLSKAEVIIVGNKNFGDIEFKKLLKLNSEQRLNKRNKVYQRHTEINESLKNNFDNFVDFQELFCQDKITCKIFTDENYLITFDGGHLTKKGAKHLGNNFIKKSAILKNIFYKN